jgi:cyclase
MRIAVLCLLSAWSWLACAAPDPRRVFAYDQVKVADGIYLFSEKSLHSVVSSNVVAVIGQTGVLIFDTGSHPSVSRQIAADVRKLTPLPVRIIVNSHWHDDHFIGNAEFAAAYPAAQIVAHRFTADILPTRAARSFGAACREEMRKGSAGLREMLRTGKRADGSELNATSRERAQSFVLDADAHATECDRMRLRGADLAFEQSLDIDLGGRLVQLKFLGRANTAGDIVAHVPDAKVLLSGDILVHPFPFATESYIGEWAQVLQKIEAMDTVAIVPGHGPVQRDKLYLTTVREVMASIDQQVRSAYQPGITLEQVSRVVNLGIFRQRIAGDDRFLQANFDYMMGLAIGRAYQEMSGTLLPEARN